MGAELERHAGIQHDITAPCFAVNHIKVAFYVIRCVIDSCCCVRINHVVLYMYAIEFGVCVCRFIGDCYLVEMLGEQVAQ